MSDNSPSQTPNLPEFTVSELSAALKRTVEDAYSYVRVRGEISGFKRATSGHLYMALKDDSAVLDGVCWRGTAGRLTIKPEDGLEVICSGKLTTYAGRSKYQIVIDSMELAGEGALLKLLEERRRKLTAEGLFDEARKRPLPYLPDVIGVVTSPTGAVIRDIIHRLNDRFPRHVLIWPVLVQGDGAAEQIAAAIDGFNRLAPDGPVPRPDLLIVARGGGSLEDLWAFNEEIVVRAAAGSAIPLISAVGHETDTTLIDFASDLRAPTPTAAAEMAVPVRAELQAGVLDSARRMVGAVHRITDERRMRLEGLARGLPDLESVLGTARQRLDVTDERLRNSMNGALRDRRQQVARWAGQIKPPRQSLAEASRQLNRETESLKGAAARFLRSRRDRNDGFAERLQPDLVGRHLRDAQGRLTALGDLLESLSFRRVLDRGYAVVRDADGRAVTGAGALAAGDRVAIDFSDGQVGAEITAATAAATGVAAPRSAPKAPRTNDKTSDKRQGKLL
jgi:exodeoxyribonuclease VII large subunit